MGILRLHPLSQCEIERKRPRFLDRLFGRNFRTELADRLGLDLSRRIITGGYPAALARRTPPRQSAWYRDYVDTQIQRDVRDLAKVRSLDALPNLRAPGIATSRKLAPSSVPVRKLWEAE
jgi:predicted AAA+ superfamily ATPase